MKVLILFLAFFVAAISAENRLREKRFFINSFIKKCSQESDCAAGKCCAFGKRCLPKLPQYSTCHLTSIHGCGCRDGLECRVTKEFTIFGKKFSLKQCMPVAEPTEIEQVQDDDEVEDIIAGDRKRRFLFDRCSQESECGENRCCLFGKVCAKKLPKHFTCFLTNRHKCGCQNGLECRVTTTIVIPIIGTKIPVRQCVDAALPPPEI